MCIRLYLLDQPKKTTSEESVITAVDDSKLSGMMSY